MISRRHWTAAIVLALTAGLAWYYSLARPIDGTKKLLARTRLPQALGGWTGRDTPPDEDTTDILRTTDVLQRMFRKPNTPEVVFQVVFAMDDRTSVHAPEECQVGGGWQIIQRNLVTLPVRLPETYYGREQEIGELPPDMPLAGTMQLTAVELVLEHSSKRMKTVLFFYKSGRKVTPSYVWNEINMLLSNLVRGTSTNALIETTTFVAEPRGESEKAAARARSSEIMQLMFPYVMAALP